MSGALSTLKTMQKLPPDDRLNYIAEALILQGAIVRYSPLTDGPTGWMVHVYEPEFPQTALISRQVLESEAADPARMAQLRDEIAGLYRSCFLS